MRELSAQAVTEVVSRLCISANRNLPEDLKKCIRRCAERNEVFVLTSHGIHPAAKHIHMKTEWLERILSTAKECGVPCLGFDEL